MSSHRSIRRGSALTRRTVLRGLYGVTLGLPFLEGLASNKRALASGASPPFAIFFRQADGVACAQENVEIGSEPERFWPRQTGALDAANVAERALAPLTNHLDRLLVVGNVNMVDFPYGDGHARGAFQVLTGHGPHVPEMGGQSEAGGESVDNRIGRELNPEGVDSLFLYSGFTGGWLGGPCISHRGRNARRTADTNPLNAYKGMVGLSSGEEIDPSLETLRARSVNDLVRDELDSLLRRKDLSQSDRRRLDLHLTSIRELEVGASCLMNEVEEAQLEEGTSTFMSTDGNLVLKTTRLHMDVAALAVACGYTRAATIQVGDGNDGNTRYWDDMRMMENYHFVSHRRTSHDNKGAIIANSDLLHHKVDVQFAETFRHLLDRLTAYEMESGTLLDDGVAIWLNDLGNGPAHSPSNIPWVIAGSAGGRLRNGQYIRVPGRWNTPSHARMLNTIATVVGCRSDGKEYCDDVGDESIDRSPLEELLV